MNQAEEAPPGVSSAFAFCDPCVRASPPSAYPCSVGLTFEHPEWLWVLLLAGPAGWVAMRWFASMSRIRRISAVAFRVLLIALIAGMLAGASSVRRSAKLAVIGVVDVSGSVRMFGEGQVTGGVGSGGGNGGGNGGGIGGGASAGAIQAARLYFDKAFAGRGPEDLAGMVVFDGRALAVAMPTRGDVAGPSPDLKIADGTDIGAALRYAAAMIPPDAAGRLVLVSDGDQNAGDALAAAREIGGRRSRESAGMIPVDVVPVALNAGREVMVESVDAPPRAPAESAITVRVSLLATDAATGELSLLRNGDLVDINGAAAGTSRRLRLEPGRHIELISLQLPAGQVHQFKAVWTPDAGADGKAGPAADTRLENNIGEAFTYTPGKGSVLLVHAADAGQPESTLAAVLKSAGVEVSVVPPEGLPDNLLALQAYDEVILENIPAEAVSEEAQRALSEHVRSMGAGLVMVGGPDSFGAGGWKGSALEPLLPVKLDLPERLVQPDAAVVLVLDNSGSMGRRVSASVYTQQEIANKAAALAVQTLAKTDLVGVVVFNTDTTVLVPLGLNTDAKTTAERIMSISPGGGTVMGPGLQQAWDQLKGVKAAVKHVIVMSDGRSMGSELLPAMAQRMKAEDGITVSTIGVGDDSDERTMGDIASNAGGKFYQVNNASLLPRFFLKAIRVVRTPLIREGMFAPVILPTASPLTAGLPTPPPLRGLVLTQKRPEPTITYAMATPTGEPLLAHWTVELGQVAAFTSDARAGGWADRWIDWPGYRQLWTTIAKTMARTASPQRMELTTEVAGDDLRLRLDAADQDGKPLDMLAVPATVRMPGGEQVKVNLSQTGPGVYEGRVSAVQTGNYIAILTPRLGEKRLSPVIGGSSVASGVEFRALKTDQGLLERVANETGGRVLSLFHPEQARLFDRADIRPKEARTPLWRSLLAWAVVVLLLDVGTRRIAWDRFVSREFGVDLAKAAKEAVAERGTAAAKAARRLREAPRPAVAQSGPKLSDEDAAALADEAAERRRRERLAALRALRESQRGDGTDEPPIAARPRRSGPHAASENDEAPAGSADLLAAKKRARERFAEGDEGKESQA